MLSRCVGDESQGKVLAVQSVLESLAKVLGPGSRGGRMVERWTLNARVGKVLAVQSVLENLAKVLGPVLHTAVYVSSLAVSPSLVYYVMAGETVLLLPAAVWVSRAF
nr:hypothetical protein BaRGS_000793 [Batillaria attramentaria]